MMNIKNIKQKKIRVMKLQELKGNTNLKLHKNISGNYDQMVYVRQSKTF